MEYLLDMKLKCVEHLKIWLKITNDNIRFVKLHKKNGCIFLIESVIARKKHIK